jgi:hypothetical protein
MLGVARSEPIRMIFDFFYQRSLKENGLVWALMNAEFQVLWIDIIFELNGDWSGVEAYFVSFPSFQQKEISNL